jgi:acyl carrier protein
LAALIFDALAMLRISVGYSLHIEVEKGVKDLLLAELQVSPELLAKSDSHTALLGHGIGLDSVETMVLVVGLEQRFDISVPDSELTTALFENIGTLTDYVVRKIGEK